MRRIKIIADSSANLTHMEGIDFASAPLKIIAGETEFVDDEMLDAGAMVEWFDSYKGKSKTSCPNPGDWLTAFGDAEDIYCITITSGLSGSYNSACVAKEMYEGALQLHGTPEYYPDKAAFFAAHNPSDFKGMTVLAKASHGMHFEEIVEWLKA